MDEHIWDAKWRQLKESIKQEWSKLSDEEIESSNGRKEPLIMTLQQRYGIDPSEAEKQLNSIYRSIDSH